MAVLSAEEHSHWTDARLRQHLGWRATNATLAPDAPRRCANGRLNPFDGRCTCDYGFAGRGCRQDVVPACRRAGGAVESCTARKALPCACVRQCLSAGAFAVHTREPFHQPVCVMGRNASVEDGRSGTRQEPQYFRWRWNGVDFQREPKPVETTVRFSPAIHLRHDEALERDRCYRNCSGARGHCVRGACVCSAPHYGPGCAFPHEGAPARKAGARLRVYVYDLAPLLTSRRSWASDWDAQRLFSTAHVFVSALLGDADAVTADAASADVFVVPQMATNMEGLPEYYSHLVAHLEASSPWWRRRGGRDHVWICSADHGGNVGASIRGVRDGIVMAHYFRGDVLSPASMHLAQAPYLHGATAVARDVYAAWAARGIGAVSRDEDARRTITLFFAGNFNLLDTSGRYSEGVRQALHHHHRNRTGYRLVKKSATYMHDFLSSQFCAAPLGEGWGIRLSWAIVHGCIPVVFTSEVHHFWGHALHYEQFAVVVDKPDLPNLHAILAAIGPAQRRRLRAGLHAVHRLFVWDPPHGLAYNMTLQQLCERAFRLKDARPSLRCDTHVDVGPRLDLDARLAADAAFERHSLLPPTPRALGTPPPPPPGSGAPTDAAAARGDEAALGVRCAAQCEAHEPLYAQIDADLAAFRGGISKRLTDAALAKWRESGIFASIMIVNGSLYKTRPHYADGSSVDHSDGQLLPTLHEIYSLVHELRHTHEPLPDLELIINADDYGRPKLTDKLILPLLSITKKRGRGADILYPTGHYASGGIGAVKNIGRYSAGYRFPWRLKRDVAFFRGRPNSHTLSRWALPRLMNGSAVVDLGLVWYMPEHDPFRKAPASNNDSSLLPPLTLLKEFAMERHAEYKYLINLDGHSYSHRLVKLLATNSVVLKEETPDLEYYYHLLKPFVHYVPFAFAHRGPCHKQGCKLHHASTNLTETVLWARAHDEEVRRIAEQAHALVHTHLCDAARRCYMRELLRRYGKAMTYRPSLRDRPGAMRVTNRGQLRKFPSFREMLFAEKDGAEASTRVAATAAAAVPSTVQRSGERGHSPRLKAKPLSTTPSSAKKGVVTAW